MSAEKSYRFESSKRVSDNGLREHTIHFPIIQELRFSIKILSISLEQLKAFSKPDTEGISQNELLLIVEQNDLISYVNLEKTLNAREQQEGSSFRYVLPYEKIPIYVPVDPSANDEATSGVYEFRGSYDFVTRREEAEKQKEEKKKQEEAEKKRAEEAAKLEEASAQQTTIDEKNAQTDNAVALSAASDRSSQGALIAIAADNGETTEEQTQTVLPPTNEEVLAVMEQTTFQTNTLPDNVVYYKQLSSIEKWFLADWPHFISSLIDSGEINKFKLDWNFQTQLRLMDAYEEVQKEYTQFKHDGDVLKLNLLPSDPPGLINVIPDWNEIYFNNADVFVRKNFPGFQRFDQINFRESQSSRLVQAPSSTSFWSVPKISNRTLALRKELLHSATGSNLDPSGNHPEVSGRGVSANVEVFHVGTPGRSEEFLFLLNGFSSNIKEHHLYYFDLQKNKYVSIIPRSEVPSPGNGTNSRPFKAYKKTALIPESALPATGNAIFYHDLYYSNNSLPVKTEYQVPIYKDQESGTTGVSISNVRVLNNENALIFDVKVDLNSLWFPSYDAEYNANPYQNPLTALIARQGLEKDPAQVVYIEITRSNGIESHTMGPYILNTVVQGAFESFSPIPQKNTLEVLEVDSNRNIITVKYREGTETMDIFHLPPHNASSEYTYVIRPAKISLGVDYFLTTGEPITATRTSENGRRYFYDAYSAEHPALRYGYSVPPAQEAIKSFNNVMRYARYATSEVVDVPSFTGNLFPGFAEFDRCTLKYLRGASVDSTPPATVENDIEEITYAEYTYNEYVHPFFDMSIKIPYSLAKVSDMAQISAKIVEAPLDGWQAFVPAEYQADVPTESENPNRFPFQDVVLSEFFPTAGITRFCDFTFPFWAQYVHDFFLGYLKIAYPAFFAESDFYVKIRYTIRFFNKGEGLSSGGAYFDYDFYDRTDMIKSTTFPMVLDRVSKITETDEGKEAQAVLASVANQAQQEAAVFVSDSGQAVSNQKSQGASGSTAGADQNNNQTPVTISISTADTTITLT